MEVYKRGNIVVYKVEVTVKLLKFYAGSLHNSANNMRLLDPPPLGLQRPDIQQEGAERNDRAARKEEAYLGAEAQTEHQIFSL